MIGEEMPPMPARYVTVQKEYAEMIAGVKLAIAPIDLAPSMALILAFIGDNSCCSADLRQRGYFLGINTSYPAGKLMRDGFIETSKGLDRRARPIKLTPKGRQIAIAIRLQLAQMRDLELAAAEAA